ncbi:large conductance mechanosensitive channel protein MscL [Pusillimonas sp. TS35]|uniref:large conductance mechanosensitive channel protein MscL n=1 Tax=Paracandidimonas lactea TaxID=2895524 RepID=UPI00136FE99B|nr:large conductance mechanosensitive channel protein MscL [Paracandidimonas lactea]MYN12402.1 large conductance mechanosensitive channel protein MscL [Pusillimonas sp. TS35]
MSKARGFLQEFREFAVKGNMIDLAVGVIIGAAFGKIIDSLVKDVIMPIINFILGGQIDFTSKFIALSIPEGYTGPQTYDALSKAGANLLAWGNFVTIFINFILLAFVVFCLVKAVNAARRRVEREEEAAPPPAPAEDVVLLREIRDLLSKR